MQNKLIFCFFFTKIKIHTQYGYPQSARLLVPPNSCLVVVKLNNSFSFLFFIKSPCDLKIFCSSFVIVPFSDSPFPIFKITLQLLNIVVVGCREQKVHDIR